ncbi:MAG: prepilin-type N-terminal cleavage/methylation domain-containing protein [Planctomycetota bacterium]
MTFPPVRPRRRPHGFSLVEMVISLSVISLLMVGMTSAVVLASRALPSNTAPAAATADAGHALQLLRDDLRAATAVHPLGPASLTLNLPDRDGDGLPEVVAYAWAGGPDDPLTRSVNGQPPHELLDRVQAFAITANSIAETHAFDGVDQQSAEQELSSVDPANSDDTYPLSQEEAIGFHFTPALPAQALAWRPTRLLIRSKKEGKTNGTARTELTNWDGSRPTGTAYVSVETQEPQLDQNLGWAEIPLDGAAEVPAGQAVAFTFSDVGSGKAGSVVWNATASPANAFHRAEDDEDWTVESPLGLVNHYLYGTTLIRGDHWQLTRPRLKQVSVVLTLQDAPRITHRLAVPLHNAPLQITDRWDADFLGDPTALDLDADGQPDWQDDAGFDPSRLVGGAWRLTDSLRTAPDGLSLDQPFTVELWLEDTTHDGHGGGFDLRFDRADGRLARLRIHLQRGSSSQTLTVAAETPGGELVTHATHTLGVDQTATVRLDLDPSRDTAAVRFGDGQTTGFIYPRLTSTQPHVLAAFVDSADPGVRVHHATLFRGGTVTYTAPDPDTAADSLNGSGGSEFGDLLNDLFGGSDSP